MTKLIEITKEEYILNRNKNVAAQQEFIYSKLPEAIICGYGYYGGRLIEENEKYYIEAICGDSCD